LLSSFSRSSWLAFTIGLLVWIAQTWISDQSAGNKLCLSRANLPLQFIVPAILAVVFVLMYRELVVSRFLNLDTPIEARSLNDRQRDADLAMELIARHPWWGVGAGNYLAAVRSFEADSRSVHSVPLLVTAELGVTGAVLWLWLTAAGLHPSSRALGPWLAAIAIGLFDVNLWMTTSWRAAIMFALLASHAALPTEHGPCAAD
jgi:O-antigen ligase